MNNRSYITDTTPAIFIVILLFVWPKENVFRGKPYGHLITWKNIDDGFPWDVILLGGGSLALAEGETRNLNKKTKHSNKILLNNSFVCFFFFVFI